MAIIFHIQISSVGRMNFIRGRSKFAKRELFGSITDSVFTWNVCRLDFREICISSKDFLNFGSISSFMFKFFELWFNFELYVQKCELSKI